MKNSSQVLRELQNLRKQWRLQNFSWTSSQDVRYTELTEIRRAIITKWKKDGKVWTGPSNVSATN
jgi:hypothetical protein